MKEHLLMLTGVIQSMTFKTEHGDDCYITDESWKELNELVRLIATSETEAK